MEPDPFACTSDECVLGEHRKNDCYARAMKLRRPVPFNPGAQIVIHGMCRMHTMSKLVREAWRVFPDPEDEARTTLKRFESFVDTVLAAAFVTKVPEDSDARLAWNLLRLFPTGLDEKVMDTAVGLRSPFCATGTLLSRTKKRVVFYRDALSVTRYSRSWLDAWSDAGEPLLDVDIGAVRDHLDEFESHVNAALESLHVVYRLEDAAADMI